MTNKLIRNKKVFLSEQDVLDYFEKYKEEYPKELPIPKIYYYIKTDHPPLITVTLIETTRNIGERDETSMNGRLGFYNNLDSEAIDLLILKTIDNGIKKMVKKFVNDYVITKTK